MAQYFRMRTMDSLEVGWAFVFIIFGILAQLSVNFLFFKVLFLQVNEIGGWNYYQVLILYATYELISITGFISYTRGFNNLPRMIEFGELDTQIVRPINLRFLTAIYRMEFFRESPGIVFAIAVLIYALTKETQNLYLLNYFLFVLVGFVIHFSFLSLISSINFFKFIPQTNRLLGELDKLGKLPRTIYKGASYVLFSIFAPIVIVYSVPVQALYNQLSMFDYALVLAVAIAFYLLARFVWDLGLKNYESGQG